MGVFWFERVDFQRWSFGWDGRRGSFFDSVVYLFYRSGFEGEFGVFIELGVESLFFSSNTLVDFLLDKFIHVRVRETCFVGDGLGGAFGDGGDFSGVVRGFGDFVSFFFTEFEVVRLLEKVSTWGDEIF